MLAADVANFGGLVSIDETHTLDTLMVTRRIAARSWRSHHGWLFGMPGDGIFALFESAVDAVRCALGMLTRLAADPKLDAMRLRIGVHLGEVLFRDGIPFGETLVIAARLESLAEPGGILVSAAVMEAVAPRVSAYFCERGRVQPQAQPAPDLGIQRLRRPIAGRPKRKPGRDAGPLDRTMLSAPREQSNDADGVPACVPRAAHAGTLPPKGLPMAEPGAPSARRRGRRRFRGEATHAGRLRHPVGDRASPADCAGGN